MNRTNFEHAAYALAMQLAIGLLTSNWWAGAAFGAAFFIGREHAQAEAKVRKEGWAKHPYFECFAPRYWGVDSLLDFIVPVIFVISVASAAQ
jgi:hypothetical protein